MKCMTEVVVLCNLSWPTVKVVFAQYYVELYYSLSTVTVICMYALILAIILGKMLLTPTKIVE